MKKILFFILLITIPFLLVNASTKQIYVDDKINVKDEIDRSAFFAGSTVKSQAKVNGIAFFAGEKITDKGYSKYALMAAKDLTIDSVVENDLFIAGDNITIRSNSFIGRDSFIFSNTLKISGEFNGNINAYSSNISIKNATIKGDIYLVSGNITIGENVIIDGKISYNDDANINIDNSSKEYISKINIYSNRLSFKDKSLNIIYTATKAFIGMLFVALIINLSIPVIFKNMNEYNNKLTFSSLFKTFGKGLLILIFIPVISIFLITSWFGLPFGIISLILYGLSIYLTPLIFGFIIGNKALRLIYKKEDNIWLNILLGLILVYIIKYLPYIGGWASIFIIIFGLGYIWEILKKSKNN